MNIALIHDDFMQKGGAENLFAQIAQIFPQAQIYTSILNEKKLPPALKTRKINATFMQKIPFKNHLYKFLLPLYPLAFESLDLKSYDLVISSTTRFSKSVLTNPNATHISYINSVPRFLWKADSSEEYLPYIVRVMLKPYFNWLKRFDLASSSRVDVFIANSKNVALSVKKIYNRESEVLYPFIDTSYFKPSIDLKKDNYYLVVSRLVKWKKIENAVVAAKKMGFNLVIVGAGPDLNRLKKLASKANNINFKNRVSNKELVELYQKAKALIVTQEEDFGLSALEAVACGTPVIAYNKGGVCEIISDRLSGILYDKQSATSLEDAILRSKDVKWKLTDLVNSAKKFTKENFENNIASLSAKYAK